jgi:hypothetical protein
MPDAILFIITSVAVIICAHEEKLYLIFQVFFTVMVGSILAGQGGPSMQGIASARGAAYHVYELIDRVSIMSGIRKCGIRKCSQTSLSEIIIL